MVFGVFVAVCAIEVPGEIMWPWGTAAPVVVGVAR